MKYYILPSSICIFIWLFASAPASHSIEYIYTADECITLAPSYIVSIDDILSNKSTANKSQQLRNLQNIFRDCSLVTRGTKYESLFYDASSIALQLSAIINDTDDYRLMSTLEDKHIEITHILEQIVR